MGLQNMGKSSSTRYIVWFRCLSGWWWNKDGAGPRCRCCVKADFYPGQSCQSQNLCWRSFTSIPLIRRLQERGMLYTGTARSNRLPGLTLMSQSDLSKKGRRSYDYKVEQINNISAVRWMDSKAVTLLSSKTGLEPMPEAQRWVKKDHAFKTAPLPAVIADYYSHMGGVDLLDAFLMSLRFKMRSRRWYIYLFWHFVMVAIINSWNIYRRDCKLLRVPKKEILSRHVNIVE